MNYTVILEPADDGSISAYVPDLVGCGSTGDTREEASSNICEAILGHVALLRESGESVPPPQSVTEVIAA